MHNASKLKYDPVVKIVVKKEILTPTHALDKNHDDILKNRPLEGYSIEHLHLEMQFQSCAVKVCTSKYRPNAEIPKSKRSKLSDRYAGC